MPDFDKFTSYRKPAPHRPPGAWPRSGFSRSFLSGPEFRREVQPPASLNGLDVPSRRAVFVPWKPSRRRGSECETRYIKPFKLHDDQVKTIGAALEKAKATSGTSVDSAALELICLDYLGGQTLQERLAVLGPEALAKTFADVLNSISKDAATAVIKSIYQNVAHDIDPQAD